MKQYAEIKSKYPGAMILFRVGDFYETFGEDAIKASQILGIVLTKRANGSASHIELAGFPHHSLDNYLPKLVRAGQRVAICDQLEDPKTTKKLVKRGVTELLTPGLAINEKVLNHKQNNYLACVVLAKGKAALSMLDLSTGEFMVAEGNFGKIDHILQSLKPSEVILAKSCREQFLQQFGEKYYTYALDEWLFQPEHTQEKLQAHFSTSTLKGFGIDEMPMAVTAAGVTLQYLEQSHHTLISHISSISRIDTEQFVWLDRFTIRNLELLGTQYDNGRSLIDVIDQCITPMGSRLLRKWMLMPLRNLDEIRHRLDITSALKDDAELALQLGKLLAEIHDLERVISKVAVQRANPRDLLQLARAQECISQVRELCLQSVSRELKDLAEQLNPCIEMITAIQSAIQPDAPVLLNKGGVIAQGLDADLDELRKIAFSGKDYLLDIQKREIANTGISSLKIAYNNVFGYYLEVTHAHKDKVPAEWIRKQTLVNAERYITDELKQYEEKIMGAEEKILVIENRIYSELLISLAQYITVVQKNASLIASLDCLLSFANLASKHKYCRPEVNDGFEIMLKDCRHPVIEQLLQASEEYVPNDIYLNQDTQQLIILTGPNMSGKSALLRQTALSVLLAQMGSYVPCSQAVVGLVDRIYTRVGASDNISQGESTFMVEMIETASILNNLSERSLVLLDEIGRGTSTFDGVSLAWSIAEYLGSHPTRPKTIFATHYHELNELESKFPNIRNYHVTIRETANKVIFMRKIRPGGSEHSFGIHVAKMAGVPDLVVKRAAEVLEKLETERSKISETETLKKMNSSTFQLNMFQVDDPQMNKVKEALNLMDPNAISPIEALIKLTELKQLVHQD